MFDSSVLLHYHLVLDLSLCSELSLKKISLALVLSFSLLSLDYLLDRVILDHLLMALHLEVIFLLSLHLFEAVNVSANLLLVVTAGSINVGPGILLHLATCMLLKGLFLFLDPLTLGSLGGNLHVSLSCTENVGCPFLGLIELLPSLSNVS